MQSKQAPTRLHHNWYYRLLPVIALLFWLSTPHVWAQATTDPDPSPATGAGANFQLFLPYIVQESDQVVSAATGSAAIGDRIWIDTNGNGVQDGGEKGRSGVQVDLLNSCTGNTVVKTATTNVNGNYTFKNLAAGSYYLRVYLPTNYQFTSQNAIVDEDYDSDVDASGYSHCITLTTNQKLINIDSGLVLASVSLPTATPTATKTPVPTATPTPAGNASIGDLIWHDLNGNGVKDIGEPGVSGVQVKLFTNCEGNTLVGTTTANVNGNYYFNNLAAGDYYARVYAPVGYTYTIQDAIQDDDYDSDFDTSGFSNCLHVEAGNTISNVDSGLVSLGVATATATATKSATPTNTPLPTATNTPLPTATATPTNTPLPTATNTPFPPTATNTPRRRPPPPAMPRSAIWSGSTRMAMGSRISANRG